MSLHKKRELLVSLSMEMN